MYLPIELQSQILYEAVEICPLHDLWKLRAVNCMDPSLSVNHTLTNDSSLLCK
jgi:hypothetical protein